MNQVARIARRIPVHGLGDSFDSKARIRGDDSKSHDLFEKRLHAKCTDSHTQMTIVIPRIALVRVTIIS